MFPLQARRRYRRLIQLLLGLVQFLSQGSVRLVAPTHTRVAKGRRVRTAVAVLAQLHLHLGNCGGESLSFLLVLVELGLENGRLDILERRWLFFHCI